MWKRMMYDGIDYGNLYLISDEGNIYGLKSGKIRKKNVNHEGYYFVNISYGSRQKKKCIKVHRAVAENFLDNPNQLPQVNHIDGNKLNNNVSNLEWVTAKENIKHAFENNLIKDRKRPGTYIISLEDNKIYSSIHEAGRAYAEFTTSAEQARKNIYSALRYNYASFGKHWKRLED